MTHPDDCICDTCFEPWFAARKAAKQFHRDYGVAYHGNNDDEPPITADQYCRGFANCGTTTAYRNLGCRGDACREAKRLMQAAWRETRGRMAS